MDYDQFLVLKLPGKHTQNPKIENSPNEDLIENLKLVTDSKSNTDSQNAGLRPTSN